MKKKQMTDSLTPWDYEPESQEKPLSPKRFSKSNHPVIFRHSSEGGRIRVRTSQKSRAAPRDIIKLQERIPSESATLPDWQVEIKNMSFLKNQLIIRIPNQFATLPPKRQADLSKKTSKSLSRHQPEPVVREKVSFLNFKKEIEALDRLRAGSKTKFEIREPNKGRGVMKLSQGINNQPSFKLFQRCPLQNMTPFDQPRTLKHQKQHSRSREGQFKKKHILDDLLSKFQ